MAKSRTVQDAKEKGFDRIKAFARGDGLGNPLQTRTSIPRTVLNQSRSTQAFKTQQAAQGMVDREVKRPIMRGTTTRSQARKAKPRTQKRG